MHYKTTWQPYICSWERGIFRAHLRTAYPGGIVRNDRLDGPELRLSPLMAALQGYERRN